MIKLFHNEGKTNLQLAEQTKEGWLTLEGTAISDNSGSTLMHNLASVNSSSSLLRYSDLVVRPWKGFSSKKQSELHKFLQENYKGLSNRSLMWCSSGSDAIEASTCALLELSGCKSLNDACFIVRKGSYHGNTFLTRALSERVTNNRKGLYSDIQVSHIDDIRPGRIQNYADHVIAELERIEGDNVKVLLLEGVGTSTSAYAVSYEAYEAIFKYCKEKNIRTILDEISSGSYRHGYISLLESFSEYFPDITVLSKGLTNGFLPIAACFVSREISDVVRHGSLIDIVSFTHGLSDITSCIIKDVLEQYKSNQDCYAERKKLVEELVNERSLDERIISQYSDTSIRLAFPKGIMALDMFDMIGQFNSYTYRCMAVLEGIQYELLHFCPCIDLPPEYVRKQYDKIVNLLN